MCREEDCYGRFLPYARDQRSLLTLAQQELVPEGDPAWFIFDAVTQWGAQRMNLWYSMGSSNRLGDAFTQVPPQLTLTCRCQMGDNCRPDVCRLPKSRTLPS
jgi:hypothetical protein